VRKAAKWDHNLLRFKIEYYISSLRIYSELKDQKKIVRRSTSDHSRNCYFWWLRRQRLLMSPDEHPIESRTHSNNSTACGIANDTVKQRRSKAIDMRYYWIHDRVIQDQFHIYWSKGRDNLAHYFTKHHPVSHHRALRVRPFYLHTANALFRSCEGVLITSSGIQELYELEELEPSSPISAQPMILTPNPTRH
jgi:hypothetical protein